jgi:hypothetical protein
MGFRASLYLSRMLDHSCKIGNKLTSKIHSDFYRKQNKDAGSSPCEVQVATGMNATGFLL